MGFETQTRQMVVLRGPELNTARKARGLKLEALAEAADVGYTTAWRAVHGEAVGVEVAGRICAVLGMDLADATASDAERRPVDGVSPAAWKQFKRIVGIRIQSAIRQSHRDVAAEAQRRCWFWPGQRTIRQRISVRERTENGECELL